MKEAKRKKKKYTKGCNLTSHIVQSDMNIVPSQLIIQSGEVKFLLIIKFCNARAARKVQNTIKHS